MKRRWLALVGLLGAGCPASTEPAACKDEPPATFDGLTPQTSFSRDVMPIFRQSCAFSTCHGSTVGDANGVFLGSETARVHQGLVGVASRELPTMPLVASGDPTQSYLMKKLDGAQCAFDARCRDGTCGASMPRGDDLLPQATRDTVRRWITQGAKND